MLRASLKLFVFLSLIVLFFIPLLLCNLLYPNGTLGLKLLQSLYFMLAKAWQIKVEIHGSLAKNRPLLVVSNHCSYLDVAVLGQLAPVRFTPKQEVSSWPLIGTLCQMTQCIFIDRRREKTAENKKQLIQALQQGSIISLFPEGTTNDGLTPLPFKSSFFSLAEEVIAGKPLAVQPVTVRYFRPDGTILSREEMDKVAWYGETEFVPHLWDFFHTQGVLARVWFHAPVTIAECAGDRKLLAKRCEEQVLAV
jgi:1-acyl-sn-glycerol-3-phosphate acyltransferase